MRSATFDIETDGLLDEVTKVWCAVVKDSDTGDIFKFISEKQSPFDIHYNESIQDLCDFLDQYDELRSHNGIAFDFPVLKKIYGWEYTGRKIDTLLMSRLQRPNRRLPATCKNKKAGPHSVEAWGHRLGRNKVEHNDWSQFSPEMLTRCEEDVEIQCLIYEALLKEGEGEGWEKAHLLNCKLFDLLEKQERGGWLVDQTHMETCISTLSRWMDRLDRVLNTKLPLTIEIDHVDKESFISKPFRKDGEYTAIVKKWLEKKPSDVPDVTVVGPFTRVYIRRTNIDSNLEMKNFLLDQGWKPEEWNTNNIGERTSPKLSINDGFRGINSALGKLVVKRFQCKQRKSVIDGWKKNIREDGRLSPIVTGLASTGRARHKNIVNVPGVDVFFGKWMRKIFIAQPGWDMVGCDSVGNQIRQLAARMEDEKFTKTVLFGNKEEGTDLHSVNMKAAGLPNRTRAKNFFYGAILFGAGDTKTAFLIDGTVKEGKAIKEKYFEELPSLKKLISSLTKEWKGTAHSYFNKKWNRMEYRGGYIKGLDGRPILIENEHTVLVYALQSDEAIQMQAAYCILHKWFDEKGWKRGEDYNTLIWMHDEWQIESKPEISKEVGELSCQAIKWAGEYFNIACPHIGEAKIGKNWYETH